MRTESLLSAIYDLANKNLFFNQPGFSTVFENSIFRVFESPRCQRFLAAIYHKSEDLFRHSVNTAIVATSLLYNIEPKRENWFHLVCAALFHDLGKIMVPNSILNKPSALNDKEWAVMREHPYNGYLLLSSLGTVPEIKLDAVLYHHCGYNFQGYPKANKCSSNLWPLIYAISLADAYDAMTSHRVYRRAMPRRSVIAEIERNLGHQFEPEVGRLFLDFLQKSPPQERRSLSC